MGRFLEVAPRAGFLQPVHGLGLPLEVGDEDLASQGRSLQKNLQCNLIRITVMLDKVRRLKNKKACGFLYRHFGGFRDHSYPNRPRGAPPPTSPCSHPSKNLAS